MTCRPRPLPSDAPSMIPGRSRIWISAPPYSSTPGMAVSVVNEYAATSDLVLVILERNVDLPTEGKPTSAIRASPDLETSNPAPPPEPAPGAGSSSCARNRASFLEQVVSQSFFRNSACPPLGLGHWVIKGHRPGQGHPIVLSLGFGVRRSASRDFLYIVCLSLNLIPLEESILNRLKTSVNAGPRDEEDHVLLLRQTSLSLSISFILFLRHTISLSRPASHTPTYPFSRPRWYSGCSCQSSSITNLPRSRTCGFVFCNLSALRPPIYDSCGHPL